MGIRRIRFSSFKHPNPEACFRQPIGHDRSAEAGSHDYRIESFLVHEQNSTLEIPSIQGTSADRVSLRPIPVTPRKGDVLHLCLNAAATINIWSWGVGDKKTAAADALDSVGRGG